MKEKKINLRKWKFALGEDETCLKSGREVAVPHTWNIEEGSEETWGTGWYEHSFQAPAEWTGKRVRVKFHAAYHNAVVYLNGTEVGKHENSGYTPFTVELTEAIRYGAANRLVVRVNNEFSDQMLPYGRCFDWANDGGLIRDVELLVTGKSFIRSVAVTATLFFTSTIRLRLGG